MQPSLYWRHVYSRQTAWCRQCGRRRRLGTLRNFTRHQAALVRRLSDKGHDAALGMHTSRRAFSPNRFDTALGQRLQEVVQHVLAPADEGGGETSPEYPTGALQDALALHVVDPLVRAVVLIAVAFDRQPRVVVSLNHQINAVLADPHLGRDPVAPL